MAKSKKPPESVNGAYTAIPHTVLDSPAFIGASDRAKSLLFALMRQHNGSNNGRLQLTDKWLAERGWPSVSLNINARSELIERGLIIQTKLGGLNIGPNWFGLTWLSITNFVGLDITANSYHRGAWADCKLPPTSRRRPPQKRSKLSEHRSSTTPTIGVVEKSATPATGAKTVFLGKPTTPITGNDVLLPLPPCKSVARKKRIVGKVGRSGIPKELHKPEDSEFPVCVIER